MKNTILFMFLLFINLISKAQTFTYSNQSYDTLIGQVLAIDSAWDDLLQEDKSIVLPLGFSVKMDNDTYDSAIVDDAAIILKGKNFNSLLQITLTGLDVSDIGIQDTLTKPYTSKIIYTTSGTSPNRIFKIEFKQFGFFNEWFAFGQFYSKSSGQIWIFENNKIVLKYGNTNIENPITIFQNNTGFRPSIWLSHDSLMDLNYSAYGMPDNPKTDLSGDSSLIGVPQNGASYTIVLPNRNFANTKKLSLIDLNIYPNPVNQILYFKTSKQLSITNIKVMNSNGVQINSDFNNYSIDVSNYETGIYYLIIETNLGTQYKKFIKL